MAHSKAIKISAILEAVVVFVINLISSFPKISEGCTVISIFSIITRLKS